MVATAGSRLTLTAVEPLAVSVPPAEEAVSQSEVFIRLQSSEAAPALDSKNEVLAGGNANSRLAMAEKPVAGETCRGSTARLMALA